MVDLSIVQCYSCHWNAFGMCSQIYKLKPFTTRSWNLMGFLRLIINLVRQALLHHPTLRFLFFYGTHDSWSLCEICFLQPTRVAITLIQHIQPLVARETRII